MAKESKIHKSNLTVFVVMGLSIVLLIVLIISSSRSISEREERTAEETSTSEESSAGGAPAEQSSDDDSQSDGQTVEPPAAEPQEPADETPEGLPVGWSSLSSAEKTALNPFDCPVGEDGVIRMSAETGECLGSEGDDENGGQPAVVPDDASVFQFGEPFVYDADSEITVNGISCTNLEFVILDPYRLNLTLGQVLEERRDDFEAYQADSSALQRDYFDRNEDLGYLDYFHYLHTFTLWRDANAPAAADADLADQLINYLDCEVSTTLKNIGEDSVFSDGCGWDFEGSVHLVGRERSYGSENRDQLSGLGFACTQAEVPFPTGATDGDSFSFIINSDDEIQEIIFWRDEGALRVVRDGN